MITNADAYQCSKTGHVITRKQKLESQNSGSFNVPLIKVSEQVEDALVLYDALATGGWNVTKSIVDDAMTIEWNTENAWMVTRKVAPFCGSRGTRYWVGATAKVALQRAMVDIVLGAVE